MKKVLESKTKVRFHDCDPYNHLNNSRYIDYIITARGDQLIEHYGFDMYELTKKHGLGWVTAQNQISYLSPAFLMEEVIIQTQLLSFSEKSLLVEGLMWDETRSRLKAIMWAKLVHFNIRTQRSQSHSEQLMKLFSSVVNPLPFPCMFEERVLQVKNGEAEKLVS